MDKGLNLAEQAWQPQERQHIWCRNEERLFFVKAILAHEETVSGTPRKVTMVELEPVGITPTGRKRTVSLRSVQKFYRPYWMQSGEQRTKNDIWTRKP